MRHASLNICTHSSRGEILISIVDVFSWPPVAGGGGGPGAAPLAGGGGGRLRMNQLSPCRVSILSPLAETSKNRTPLAATSVFRDLRSWRCTVIVEGWPGAGVGVSSANSTPAFPTC